MYIEELKILNETYEFKQYHLFKDDIEFSEYIVNIISPLIPDNYRDAVEVNKKYLNILDDHNETSMKVKVNLSQKAVLLENINCIEITRFYPNIIKNLILNDSLEEPTDGYFDIFISILELREYTKIHPILTAFLNISFRYLIRKYNNRKYISNAIDNILINLRTKFNTISIDVDIIYLKELDMIEEYFNEYSLKIEKRKIDYIYFHSPKIYISQTNGIPDITRTSILKQEKIDLVLNEIKYLERIKNLNKILS